VSEHNDPGRRDEAALDGYLKGGSAVSQRYREVSNDEVPATLDQRVLGMAHAAAEKSKGRQRRGGRSSWIAPLALAASAVLVVSIVIESGVHKGEDRVASQPVLTRPSREAPPADAGAQRVLQDEKSEPTEPNRVTSVVTQAPAAPALPAARADEAAQIAADARRAQQILEQTAPGRAEERKFAVPPPAAPAGESKSPEAETSTVVTSARPDYAGVSNSPVAVDSSELDDVIVTGVRARRDAGGSGPRNTVRPAASRQEHASKAVDAPRTPEAWLEEIRELRRHGRDRDADKEWERFRKLHPDYVIAEDDRARPTH
jgi:hypothetical protein